MSTTVSPLIEEVLAVRSLAKSFGGTRALDAVSLSVDRAELRGLVGHNGSGKSTLVKILAGYHEPDPGSEVLVEGRRLPPHEPKASLELGLRFVHQDLALVPSMSVSENINLLSRASFDLTPLGRAEERAVAADAMARLGYDMDVGRSVSSLTESEKAAVALARALHPRLPGSARVLVLDEVTSSMPAVEVQRLFRSVRQLAETGVAVLFVSHDFSEVLDLCTTVSVLRNGKLVTTTPTQSLTLDTLVELALGRAVRRSETSTMASRAGSGEPALVVRGLRGELLSAVDIELHPGEVLGIAGLTGSGREELANLLTGAQRPRAGQVIVAGSHVAPGDPAASRRVGVALVPSDRGRRALLPTGVVRENLTLADLRPFRPWCLSHRRERSEVVRWAERLQIRSARPEAAIRTLSGGNQQKVVLARWLRVEPRVLVLDEPTQGVDVGSREDIHQLILEAAKAGMAVLVCSTDNEELVRLSERVLVLHRGRTLAELRGAEITDERIEELQLLAGSG